MLRRRKPVLSKKNKKAEKMEEENLVSLVNVSFLKKSLAIAISLAMLVIAIGSASAGCVGVDTCADFGCGDTITESCTFNENMSCPTGHGLIIGANNITIDGNGYTLDGVNSVCTWGDIRCGILDEGYDNIVLKDLEVKKFCFGIRLSGTSSNHIENNTIENCNVHLNGNATSEVSTHGIKMEYVFNSTIGNNSIHDTIAHVDPNPGCEDGGNGMFLYKGDYNLITQNKFYNNTKGGILIKMKPMYNNISYNELWGNGQGGIILRCKLSAFNTIEHNDITDNYGSGIYIGGNNNTVKNNKIYNNKDGGPYYECSVGGRGYGINIGRSDGSCYNKLYGNTICGNDYRDVYVVSGVIWNTGDENTCDTTQNYDDAEATGCTYGCGGNPGCVAEDGTVYRCGDTVMKSCTFNGSMTCTDTTKPGLEIGADNIVIDGGGYKITGNENVVACGWASEGDPATHSGIVNLNDYDNVLIKNLEIEKFCTGIVLKCTGSYPGKVTNNTVFDCSIHDNGNGTKFDPDSPDEETSTHGIHLIKTEHSTITGNDIYSNNGTGTSCSAGGNGIFVYACGGLHNNITCNYLHNNRAAGIFMKKGAKFYNISHNNASANGGSGIDLKCMRSDENVIEYNTASGNAVTGIFIGGKLNTIRHNTANNNGYFGIYMGRSDGSYNNELYGNTACRNNNYDIRTCGPECYGNHGDNNTCDTTENYNDNGTTGCTYSCQELIFDTKPPENPYPSIFGTHRGKIILDKDITVNKMYTYPCKGTGGHTDYVKIWNESEAIEGIGHWSGYQGDYHNITISPTITLLKNHEYNYIIRTGSYPQIIHAKEYKAEGGNITCEEFKNANGKVYDNWIPAIKLWRE